MRRLLVIAVMSLITALACNLPGLTYNPPTGRSTTPPTATFIPIGVGPGTPSRPPTETPLPPIDVTLRPTPAITDTGFGALPATPTQFTLSTNTPAFGVPLSISNVFLVSVERDPSRPNGAIAKIKIEFSGGSPPYTFYDEDIKQPGNPVEALTDCGATLVHSVHVEAADGQRASQAYYFSPITCP